MIEKILVVDDETDLELLIKQKFRKQIREGEFNFVFAGNGLEALAKLIEQPDISIILTDINMPEMDGLTLLLKVNEFKNPSLKVVIVSAYGDMDNIRTAMNRGAYDFLTKPVDFTDLEITIKKTIEEVGQLRKSLQEHKKLVSIERDLNIARDIQLAILPKVFPPFPDKKEFDIFGFMTAAKSVGGDFFDFFLIDENRLGFVVGDVSGKGVPAAIFMAVSRTLIRATGLKGMPPAECLAYANRLLKNESTSSMFVTVFYGILDIRTGVVEYSNGGHNQPVIIKNDGTVEMMSVPSSMVLGITDDTVYETGSFKMSSGDIFILYTDGVTEAFNKSDELYSEARLIETLKGSKNHNISEIVKTVVDDVYNFSKDVPQTDDITTLALIYN
jgi:sigma-B regulation protein RsbU (phosphoserine phosphatase)